MTKQCNILVTGGTGFIGSNLVRELIKQDHTVHITGNESEQALPELNGIFFHHGLIGIDWDALPKIDVLFHQAAINTTTFMDRREMLHANLETAKILFNRVIKAGCKRIVYASSTAIYGDVPAPYREEGKVNPLNPYAESKLLLDEYAMELAKQHPEVIIVGLRYCNVYGPGESHKGKRANMIFQLAQQMRKGDPKIFKHGEQKRDNIYVKDVVLANIKAMQSSVSCVVNCGSGHATTFNRIIEILNDVLGTERKPIYIENPYIDKYQDHTECDMSKAKELIGFVPQFSIEEGIKDYFDSGKLV